MASEVNDTVSSDATIPSAWPGAWGLYKYSKNVVMVNIGSIIGLYVVSLVLMAIIGTIGKQLGLDGPITDTVNNLLSLWFSVAITLVTIVSVRKEKIDIVESLKRSIPFYLNALVLSILTIIISAVSLALLIVPFFFVAPRISLAMYYLLDKNLTPVDALKASWEATRGNVG
jgi:hypothetical protein